jgi:iron complex outermembrane receptor protein
MGAHEITVGGGYRLTRENTGNTDTLSFNPSVTTANLFNAFAQDKIALVPDRLFLTLGSKVEHNDDTGIEFEPNARLQWFPDDRQTIWLAASKAVRTPSPLERNIDLNAAVFPPSTLPFPTEYNLFANGGFQSERLIAYEGGYRNQITSSVSADAAVFYNDYNGISAQELVGVSVVPNLVTPQYILFQTRQSNLMTAETYGAEFALEWSVTDDWKLSGNYSLLKMALHLDNDFTNLQAEEDQSPQQMASVRSYWNINKNLSLDTSAYYVDRLKAFDVPSYVRLDANLGWRIGQGLKFNLVGQNLLDGSHREYNSAADLNAEEVPRTFFGKITWRF